jgi:hypothetical protein
MASAVSIRQTAQQNRGPSDDTDHHLRQPDLQLRPVHLRQLHLRRLHRHVQQPELQLHQLHVRSLHLRSEHTCQLTARRTGLPSSRRVRLRSPIA